MRLQLHWKTIISASLITFAITSIFALSVPFLPDYRVTPIPTTPPDTTPLPKVQPLEPPPEQSTPPEPPPEQPTPPEPPPEQPTPPEQFNIKRLLGLINEVRGIAGLRKLTWDERLTNQAEEWSEELATTHRIEHSGHNVYENIYRGIGYDTPQDVLDTWMDSPGHKKNIFEFSISSCGIGSTTNKASIPYVVFMAR